MKQYLDCCGESEYSLDSAANKNKPTTKFKSGRIKKGKFTLGDKLGLTKTEQKDIVSRLKAPVLELTIDLSFLEE